MGWEGEDFIYVEDVVISYLMNDIIRISMIKYDKCLEEEKFYYLFVYMFLECFGNIDNLDFVFKYMLFF